MPRATAAASAEDVRMAPGLDGQAAAWYQIRVRPVRRNGREESVWTVADITADRKSEEGAVQGCRTR